MPDQTETRHLLSWYGKYKDGSEVHEYDEEGNWHPFSEIDQPKLVHFGCEVADRSLKIYIDLKNYRYHLPGENGIEDIIDIDPEDIPRGGTLRPIWFKRIRQHFNAEGGEEGGEIAFVLGVQTTVDGKNYQLFCWIQEGAPVYFTKEK